jgi:hypothetical protein
VKIEELKNAADERKVRVTHPDDLTWDRANPRVVLAITQGECHWIEVVLITSLVLQIPDEAPDGKRVRVETDPWRNQRGYSSCRAKSGCRAWSRR